MTLTADAPDFVTALFSLRPQWFRWASCIGVDPELFFSTCGDRTDEAKAVCAECPVSEECLAFALATREKFGIWGGMSERERRRLRRARALARRNVASAS